MSSNFRKDMDKYIAGKRRKKLFSSLKSRIMNKKAVMTYKTASQFEGLKENLRSRVIQLKQEKQKPKKEITQEEIDELVERRQNGRISLHRQKHKEETQNKKEEDDGWKEVKLGVFEAEEEKSGNLEQKKREIEEDLVKIKSKEKEEEETLAKLSDENQQRQEVETEQEKMKRLELEEEINVLKEKQRIEEERLAELRRARKIEQMEALRGKVIDILFKKRPKVKKDMAEEVRKEVIREAKTGVETRKLDRIKEEPKLEEPEKEIKEEIEQEKKQISETKAEEKEEPKKSFFSNFIEIKTTAQIAKEEQERLKQEEEQALKDQLEISKLFQTSEEEVRTNVPTEEGAVDLSTLFPDESKEEQTENSECMIELDQGYKIKVVKNQ